MPFPTFAIDFKIIGSKIVCFSMEDDFNREIEDYFTRVSDLNNIKNQCENEFNSYFDTDDEILKLEMDVYINGIKVFEKVYTKPRTEE